jgi:hypothetical protein
LCIGETGARLNRLEERVTVFDADAESIVSLKSAGLSPESFDRVLMNPPFHDARRHNALPIPAGGWRIRRDRRSALGRQRSLASESKWRAGPDLARGHFG